GLEALGIDRAAVTHIVCTHVHMDHAGAAGHLLEHLPNASVVIHSRDHRHLADPARLVASVQEAVGPLFARYGEVRPVPPGRLLPAEELRLDLGGGVRLEAVPTPGHSKDHLAYFAPHAGLLFVGDAAGVSVLDHTFLLPVAAPPAFDPAAMLRSLEVMRALQPAGLCFTHFGLRTDPPVVFDRLAATLRRWDEIVRERGVAAAGDVVYEANLPPPGTPPEDVWRYLAEMNRRGFVLAYEREQGTGSKNQDAR
ncbi:MAG: MBL fold metallo-hydrolase, partial [Anaerolineae bacterium]|nr:MBL fold metallo-hydrolase [Anaerolineae bacterium]